MISRYAAVLYISENGYIYGSAGQYEDHEKYIVEEAKGFSKIEWFKSQNASFAKNFSVAFAEILTKRSVGFTFNILKFDDLLNNQT